MSSIPIWRRSGPSCTSKHFLSSFLNKLTAFDISTYFDAPKPKQLPRQVLVNLPLPPTAWKSTKKGKILVGRPTEAWEHPNNQVRTAKYSLLTFVPRNLAEQFRRIANVFFLLIAILQFLPKFSEVSPILGALPLFVVLAITAIKDAYEDFRRHAADYQTNHQLVDVLSRDIYTNPNITKPHSSRFSLKSFFRKKNIQVDAAKFLTSNHRWSRQQKALHSDVLPRPKSINSHDIQDLSKGFVPTAWQDLRVGDFVRLKNNEPVPADIVICSTSDLEENVCFIETKNLDGETNLKSRNALQALNHIRCANDCAYSEDPKNRFLIENQAPDANMFTYSAAVTFPELNHRVPISLESVLLRGTVIRNTEWVIGLIVLTGPDTKIMLNSNASPSKRSKVERQMNPMVLVNLGILAIICIFNSIGTYISDLHYYRRNSYWTIGSDLPDDNPQINGLVGFANALVTYQNIVPISLYISIEFVRTVQAYFIWADDDLAVNDRRTAARSWNLSDDLGQIQYIFSDKTGTLTQNLMQFKKCCVGGIVYGDVGHPKSLGEEDEGATQDASIEAKWSDIQANSVDSNRDEILSDQQSFFQREIEKDLMNVNTEQSQQLQRFFMCLGLCHTVLASEDEHGSMQYKAQSPDEAALVKAAADVGFVFRGMDKNIVKLNIPTYLSERQTRDEAINENIQKSNLVDTVATEIKFEEYELLEVNEFTSTRKRMSVVIQRLMNGIPIPGELYLFVKGADNVIFERLAPLQGSIRQKTDAHLEVFASEGLRTLCLAYRKLDRAQLEAWSFKYAQARSHLGQDRESLITSVQDELEKDLILLGATAIEDKLQDGVPEAIDDLKRAGIKVWVATGDKLETAVGKISVVLKLALV